ncbi:MAG: glucoamylase family protein [Ignavibacteria bacterium]|nr:glucoamylase family protein [Ignavibacteria bacterium]
MIKTIYLIFLYTLFFFVFAQNKSDYISADKLNYVLIPADEKFIDTLQHRAFLYFINEINPQNGLVKDRSTIDSPASIAAVGFALASYGVGVERGWIKRKDAAQLVLNTLRFFWKSEQSENSYSTGYKGFFYHFLDMKTGKRRWDCELSTVDTGLLMMGIIFARNYYNLDNNLENEIHNLSNKLIERLNWDFFEMPVSGEYAYTISMGWTPEEGMHNMGWSGYNEALFLYILAAGSGMTNVEAAYESWLNSYDWRTPYPGLSHAAFPPLFGHQFSHTFIDFRGLVDKYMKEKGIDYFENSRRATYVQRQYAIDNPSNWAGYDSLCWGLTACDGPGESYNKNGMKFLSYAGRGTSGPELVYFDDGTIAPTAAAGSIVFAPEIVIPTLMNINEKYSSKGLWGQYGFLDSFNLTLNWFNSDYLGIDQGPIVIMIENFRTGLVWKYVMKDPLIQEGLVRLGFTGMESD